MPRARAVHFPTIMKMTALLVSTMMAIPMTASAQTSSTASGDFDNLPVPSWGKAVLDSFSKPLHPIIGGVGSGGGVGVGVGYDSPDEKRWYQKSEAIVTIRRYWGFEGEIGHRSLSGRSQLGAFGAVRHLGRVDFFGLGPDSTFDQRTSFRLRETIAGTRGWYRLAPAIRLGGSAAMYKPALGRGTNRAVPAIEELFPIAEIPGFAAEPTFGRYRGVAEFRHPAPPDPDTAPEEGAVRGAYQLAFEAVRDYDTGRYNFHRLELEAQQRFRGITQNQRLTLHGLVATTNSGSEVPFYMLYTLGGGGGLKSFRPGMLGTDGTNATLRGFRNFRFRDRNLVLMQAEYRIPLHRRVHTTVFVDAGQVAPRTSELFSDIRQNVGFSLSYMRGEKTVGRMDVGFGGGEGVHLFWSFGFE